MIPAIAIGLVIGGLCARTPAPRSQRMRYGQRMNDAHGKPSPTPYPWMSTNVNIAIKSGLSKGITDPDALALYACKHSYPVTPWGSPATWNPFAKQGTHEKACYLKCLARARALIAIDTDYAVNGPDSENI